MSLSWEQLSNLCIYEETNWTGSMSMEEARALELRKNNRMRRKAWLDGKLCNSQYMGEMLTPEEVEAIYLVPQTELKRMRAMNEGPDYFRLNVIMKRYRRGDIDRWLADGNSFNAKAERKVKKQLTYFIHQADHIKIGKSENAKKRLANLQTASPIPLTLLKVAEVDERETHAKFKHLHVIGEWYLDCVELRQYIAALNDVNP